MFCELWFLVYLLVYLFHYKDREVFFFLICALRIVIFGREFSLSTLTFHFFIYSFIRFFTHVVVEYYCEKERQKGM